MDSVYYCFLCDAEFNSSEEWNPHLSVSLFIKLIFSTFLN